MIKVATISETVEKYSDNRIPVFSFAFDDSRYSTLEKAYPILNKHNFPATVFVITGLIGKSNYLTRENLYFLSRHGWEIGSHSVNHRRLPGLSEKEIRTELLESKQHLENWGFKVNTFAFPGGEGNQLIWDLARQYYKSSRGVAAGLNYRPFCLCPLKNFAPSQYSKVQLYKDRIDQCIRETAWMILSFHEIDALGRFSNSSEFLATLCDYIAYQMNE